VCTLALLAAVKDLSAPSAAQIPSNRAACCALAHVIKHATGFRLRPTPDDVHSEPLAIPPATFSKNTLHKIELDSEQIPPALLNH
jgi:hypothetical protein